MAILLLVLVSLTVGSVSQASGQNGESGTLASYGLKPHGMLPPLSGHRSTSVILDMSGQETVIVENGTWHPPGPMPPGKVCYFRTGSEGDKAYMSGRVIVQSQGDSKPLYFPVRYKHLAPNETGKPFMDIYRMEPTTFKYGDLADSNFTFGGDILVVNKSFAGSNLTGDQSDPYYNSISAGQTTWQQAQVTGSSTAFNVDLKWNNTNDDLTLTIYTPDGHILGPYTDSSDGKSDGRINMEIDNSAGVADGTWILKVADNSATGKDEYYLRTW